MRQFHLLPKHFLLHFARRVVVVIVDPYLAPGNYFAMLREPSQRVQMRLGDRL